MCQWIYSYLTMFRHSLLNNKMKNKRYDTIRTESNSNRKITETRVKIYNSTIYTNVYNIHDLSFYWLRTGILIKSGGINLKPCIQINKIVLSCIRYIKIKIMTPTNECWSFTQSFLQDFYGLFFSLVIFFDEFIFSEKRTLVFM